MCVPNQSRDRRNQETTRAEKYEKGLCESGGIRCVVITATWTFIKETRVFVLYYSWSDLYQVQHPLHMVGRQLKRSRFDHFQQGGEKTPKNVWRENVLAPVFPPDTCSVIFSP